MNTENIDKSLFEFAAFDEMESEHIAAPRYSYWKSVWKTFFKNKFTVAVAALLIIVVAFALIRRAPATAPSTRRTSTTPS